MARQLFEFMPMDKGHLVVESTNGGKDLCMSGIFIQGDVRNQNERVYPLREISKAVGNVTEKIHGGLTVLGELDHPEELSINLDRVSHMITEMWMDGNNGYGKLKVMNTPCGNIAKSLLEAGAKLGVSSRGSGNVSEGGEVSDFDIVTVDIVAQPSAPDAYPRTIYESLFNMRGGQQLYGVAEAASYDPSAARHLQKNIIKFINDLKL